MRGECATHSAAVDAVLLNSLTIFLLELELPVSYRSSRTHPPPPSPCSSSLYAPAPSFHFSRQTFSTTSPATERPASEVFPSISSSPIPHNFFRSRPTDAQTPPPSFRSASVSGTRLHYVPVTRTRVFPFSPSSFLPSFVLCVSYGILSLLYIS